MSGGGVLRGLFVGVDRYSSPLITELRCAERDARALHSLFADTLGGEPELVCGASATRENLEQRLDALSGCDPDDVVVLSFSGHGTDTHQLVMHDADLMDLSGTCISLDRLTELFAAIPARRLVCFLDCCFSGGMGAKVLHAPERARSPASAEARIDRMAGEGRIILTASASDEEAWENLQRGHGLLTHYLLQGLQGAEEVRSGGQVAVLRLLEWVTARVMDDAAGKGHRQHPALRGTIEGRYTWPIFTQGAHYAAAFPERVRQPATKDVSSLRSFGLPNSVLDAWAAAAPARTSSSRWSARWSPTASRSSCSARNEARPKAPPATSPTTCVSRRRKTRWTHSHRAIHQRHHARCGPRSAAASRFTTATFRVTNAPSSSMSSDNRTRRCE